MASRWQKIQKRLTRTANNTKDRVVGLFSFKNDGIYNNETTWLELYRGEPFIRGAIDAKLNAAIGDWVLENVNEKPSEKEEKLLKQIKADLSHPKLRTNMKLRTIGWKYIIDSVVYIETQKTDGNYYILNSENCDPVWDDKDKFIIGFDWGKEGKDKVPLRGDEAVLGSVYDFDTNLFKLSPLQTLIDIGNLLYHARRYNLGIFENGGMPSAVYQLPEGTSPEEFKRFERLLSNTTAGKNLITKGIIKIDQIAGFTKDMEYDKLVDHAVQSIMTLLNVSPLMMNMGGSSSPSGGESSKQEMNAFATGVHALQREISDLVTQVIHNLYGTIDEDDPQVIGRPKKNLVSGIRFKLRKWVDPRQLSAIHKIYLDTKVITPNEAREDLGREPREGGDEVLEDGAGAMGNTGGENPSGQDRESDSGKPKKDEESSSNESASQAAEKKLHTHCKNVSKCDI